MLVATNKDYVFLIENCLQKTKTHSKALKIDIGRFREIKYIQGVEVNKEEVEEEKVDELTEEVDLSTNCLIVASSTEGRVVIWSIEDFLD